MPAPADVRRSGALPVVLPRRLSESCAAGAGAWLRPSRRCSSSCRA